MFTLLQVLAVAVFASGSDFPWTQQESLEIRELTRLESVWNEAHVRSDANALDELWADDLSVTVPNMPVMTKKQVLEISRAGTMKFQRYETSDIRIRIYRGTGVVTGRLLRTRSFNGRDVEDNWRFTKVYVRLCDTWKVVAWQASTINQQ